MQGLRCDEKIIMKFEKLERKVVTRESFNERCHDKLIKSLGVEQKLCDNVRRVFVEG